MVRTMRNYCVQLAMISSIVMAPVFAATVAGATAPSPAPVMSQGVVVKDPENRFTIMVPASWAVQTSTSARAAAVSAKSLAPNGHLPTTVDVITHDLPTPLDAQQCADKVAQIMRFTIHNWTTLHEGVTTLAGLPGYSRAYTWHTSTGQERRSDQTCVTMGRRAFVVIGTTANDPRSVQQALSQLQRIIATFHPNATNLPPIDHPASRTTRAGDH